MNPEDKVRDAILKFLYEFNKEKAQWVTPPTVVHHLKQEGFDKHQVTRGLNFLKDEGFVNKKVERAGGMSFEKIMISSKGIQLFEKSKFVKKTFSTISLEGDNNVLVLGDNLGSITQTKGNSIDELNKLIKAFRTSALTEEEKMNLIGDVETIKSQLVKPNPSKAIIQGAWATISAASTFSGAHDLIAKVKTLLSAWL
jgi:Fe2+ or Zn2+ uptake regulation protein